MQRPDDVPPDRPGEGHASEVNLPASIDGDDTAKQQGKACTDVAIVTPEPRHSVAGPDPTLSNKALKQKFSAGLPQAEDNDDSDSEEGDDITSEQSATPSPVKPPPKKKQKPTPSQRPQVMSHNPSKAPTANQNVSYAHPGGMMYKTKEGRSVPAVYHADIRAALLHAASQQGAYSHARTRGKKVPDDETAFLASQKDWADKKFSYRNIPHDILNIVNPASYTSPDAGSTVPPWFDSHGRIILDEGGEPVLKHDLLPDTLSSQIEGFWITAVTRLDTRIRTRDIWARIPKGSGGETMLRNRVQGWMKKNGKSSWNPSAMTKNNKKAKKADEAEEGDDETVTDGDSEDKGHGKGAFDDELTGENDMDSTSQEVAVEEVDEPDSDNASHHQYTTTPETHEAFEEQVDPTSPLMGKQNVTLPSISAGFGAYRYRNTPLSSTLTNSSSDDEGSTARPIFPQAARNVPQTLQNQQRPVSHYQPTQEDIEKLELIERRQAELEAQEDFVADVERFLAHRERWPNFAAFFKIPEAKTQGQKRARVHGDTDGCQDEDSPVKRPKEDLSGQGDGQVGGDTTYAEVDTEPESLEEWYWTHRSGLEDDVMSQSEGDDSSAPRRSL